MSPPTATGRALVRCAIYTRQSVARETDRVLPAYVDALDRFEVLDVDVAFLESLSSLAHPGVVPVMLQIGTRQQSRAQVRAWLDVHGAHVAPELERLAKGKGRVAELAREEIKTLAR